MAFIDELRDKAGDMAQIASKKVGEAYAITRVKMALADRRSALRTLYKELGEMTYKNYKEESEDNEALEDKIAEIDLALEAINELKNSERKIKNVVMCTSCNADVDTDFKFCPKCGSEMN